MRVILTLYYYLSSRYLDSGLKKFSNLYKTNDTNNRLEYYQQQKNYSILVLVVNAFSGKNKSIGKKGVCIIANVKHFHFKNNIFYFIIFFFLLFNCFVKLTPTIYRSSYIQVIQLYIQVI